MQIIAHRGAWNVPQAHHPANSLPAFEQALHCGWGIEVDIRDYGGELRVSHNPAQENSLPLCILLERYVSQKSDVCIALNVKADGLQMLLTEQLNKYHIKHYFTFDMSIPNTLEDQRAGLNFFLRQSEFEQSLQHLGQLYQRCKGLWIDQFEEDERMLAYNLCSIPTHIAAGKRVCFVSPELHSGAKKTIVIWEYGPNLSILPTICLDHRFIYVQIIPSKRRNFLMEKINIVIPMAGQGSRFAKAGYSKPKPFIDVLGKPMIAHVLENLSMPNARFILLARTEHYEKEPDTVKWIKENYPAQFVLVDKLTEGAACTVLHAHRLINNTTPLLIANSDQLVDMDISDYLKDSQKRLLDGSVLCFEADHPKWSYAKLDAQGLITEIREKQVISPHATVGIYYFEQGRYFVENALDMFVRNDRVNNEFYVAPVYNYAIKQGKKFGIYSINKSQMHGIGTPEDLDAYLAWRKDDDH